MPDTRTPDQRRRIMQSVNTKNTGPELIVRRVLHRMGYRYRLHARDLPGKPDVVFPRRKKAIFVHGCFWHGHGCRIGKPPKSRPEYWIPKLEANKARDSRQRLQLEALGWSILVVWQCETRDTALLESRLQQFFGHPRFSAAESTGRTEE